MIDEVKLDKIIEELLISDVYYKGIIIEYFNSYCLQVFGRIYDYNVFNIKVFLLDLFNIKEHDSCFLLKTKEEIDESNINYLYVSCLTSTRITNIDDFKDYIEQQLYE